MKTLYRGATLTDKNGSRNADLLVEDGVITYIGDAMALNEVDELVDCDGLTIMPGFIDTHAHLRDPGYIYKEDLESGLNAAAKGGYTTVCAMANTNPVMDSEELIKENLDRAESIGKTGLIQVSSLTKDFGSELVEIPTLSELTPIFSNDGHNVDEGEIMRKALELSKEYGVLIATHNEPETETVLRDIDILRETGGRLHICHISKADTLKAIQEAKEEGLDITCEVTPHHLYASGIDYRVHPPFRTNKDKMTLIKGVRNGIIDTFGSDHAPHSQADKIAGSPGLDNFEVAFALYNTVADQNNIPLTRLSEMFSYNPAKILGLPGGLLEVGEPANLVLVDPEEEWQINTRDFISKSQNNPFHRDWVKGRVHRTIRDGRVIYDSGIHLMKEAS